MNTNTKSDTLRVGDTVLWRGGWGRDAPQWATVTHLEVCVEPGDKYGVPVDQVPWVEVDRVIVDLDNRHWAYGSQIEPLGVI